MMMNNRSSSLHYRQYFSIFVTLLLLSSLSIIGVVTANAPSCPTDDEGNCLDRSCVDKFPDCEKWAKTGECRKGQSVKFMVNFCKKACDICEFAIDGNLTQLIALKGDVGLLETPFGYTQTTTIPPEDEDDERSSSITSHDIQKVIDDMGIYMKERVYVEDKYRSVRAVCKNTDARCSYWKAKGRCDLEPSLMSGICAPACQFCEYLDMSQRCPVDQSMPKHLNHAGDLNALFERLTSDPELVQLYHPRILSKPQSDDNNSSPPCVNVDTDDNCDYWASIGECTENPEYMHESCAKSCNICNEVVVIADADTQERVVLEQTATKSVDSTSCDAEGGEGSANTNTCVNNSNNNSKSEDTNNNTEANNDNTPTADEKIFDGPWVVELPNFLTSEECDRVIELGTGTGYIDSSQFIGDKDIKARNSKQMWCNKENNNCVADPIMKQIERKIEHMSTVPVHNFEYMQLLKYDVGEFYKTHSDYNPLHRRAQTGVRILTVYLYLNDVEEGGGTNFPQLNNLTVIPEKGKAVIWPSVVNHNPDEEETRTNHQALPVTKGIKYGANVWQHQREYRNSHDWGCTSV